MIIDDDGKFTTKSIHKLQPMAKVQRQCDRTVALSAAVTVVLVELLDGTEQLIMVG